MLISRKATFAILAGICHTLQRTFSTANGGQIWSWVRSCTTMEISQWGPVNNSGASKYKQTTVQLVRINDQLGYDISNHSVTLLTSDFFLRQEVHTKCSRRRTFTPYSAATLHSKIDHCHRNHSHKCPRTRIKSSVSNSNRSKQERHHSFWPPF